MKILFRLLLLGIFINTFQSSFAQLIPNDNCNGAIFLENTDNYCSVQGAYSNQRATNSPQARPGCFAGGQGSDVWFAFNATNTGISIRIVGATTIFTGGTLERPQAVLYGGTCDNLMPLNCDADEFSNITSDYAHVAALQATNLQVGETYFIRVEGQNAGSGTFQLCLTSFDPVPDPLSDCNTGVLLCDKSPFIVPFLSGNGDDPDEVDGPPCQGPPYTMCDYSEAQSAWYKWICKDPGTLTFTLTPLNPVDDLDFWIYELPSGVDDCSDKIPLLCMTSGMNQGEPVNQWIRCHGPTGLSADGGDTYENCGCSGDDNNFLAPLQMETGKAYALVIMNFSSTGDGFSIDFGGTGTLVGPDVNFEIEPILDNQCDVDSITFTDLSTPGIGTITNYEWNFGSGATPRSVTNQGPHEVIYSSFGTKNIVLRITSDAGCTVTEIRSIFIEPCCDPNNDLEIDVLNIRDPLCPGTPSGSFEVGGSGGVPQYLFSQNGVDFLPIDEFGGLLPGNYQVFIQDTKGCIDSTGVLIEEPPPFSVEAGPDQTIELGASTSLRATISPDPFSAIFNWQNDTTLSCVECLSPEVFPALTTTYTITASNAAGCEASDSVTVFVQVVRPVYIPSAFSPNDDGINDFFTIYTGPQARNIQRLLIFDRWGNLVFEGRDLLPNEDRQGWNGTFRGKKMDPAVFAYYAEVEFIDGIVVPYEGDVTLFR